MVECYQLTFSRLSVRGTAAAVRIYGVYVVWQIWMRPTLFRLIVLLSTRCVKMWTNFREHFCSLFLYHGEISAACHICRCSNTGKSKTWTADISEICTCWTTATAFQWIVTSAEGLWWPCYSSTNTEVAYVNSKGIECFSFMQLRLRNFN